MRASWEVALDRAPNNSRNCCIFFNLQSLPVNPTVLLWKTNKISEIEMLTLLCLFKIATLTHHFPSSSGEGHRHLNAKEIKKLSQRQVGRCAGGCR